MNIKCPVLGFPAARTTAASLVLVFSVALSARAQIGGGAPAAVDASPTTNTDVSSMISTGCGYDAWTGSSHREVVDLVVPAAVSEHGLKWTRTYNSSTGGWRFAYTWRYWGRPNGVGRTMEYPDGRVEQQRYCSDQTTGCFDAGTKDRLLNPPPPVGQANDHVDLILEDGSDIHMDMWSEQSNQDTYWIDHVTPTQITDRYGRVTILDWELTPTGSNTPDQIRLAQVTDLASGRWIKITYYSDNSLRNDPQRIDTSNGDWVVYNWGSGFLTDVYYSDGTSAHYTYAMTHYNCHDSSGNPMICGVEALSTAKDTRAEGPMQSIYYEYRLPGNFKGEISMERDLNPDGSAGAVVSACDNKISRPNTSGTRTETCGYGPYSRQIHMVTFKNTEKMPPMVMWKEDFNHNTEYFTYDPNSNYLTDVKDFNGNTTHYDLEPVIGNPTQITHPRTSSDTSGPTHISYYYSEPLNLGPGANQNGQTQNVSSDQDNPYYVSAVTDERLNTTHYVRDDTVRSVSWTPPGGSIPIPYSYVSHLITEIDYPDSGKETFTYNNFGQVTVHQRKNGAYEYAQYDSTGLLLKLWNPTWTPPSTWGWSDADPHTTLTYYPAGHLWQDRVQTVTDQRGYRTTYEYDHSFDANGNQTSTPCPGRGLVTKISYPDDTHNGQKPGGTSKSFTYDIYGNKLSETNELGKTTRHAYDDYMRLTTTTDPLQHTTTLNYTSTTGQSPYSHTTKSWRYHTLPTGGGDGTDV